MSELSPVIVVSGPPGAGKSTVARLLADSGAGAVAYIEGDTFWRFFVRFPEGSKGEAARTGIGRIMIQAMIATGVRFARGGYETIVDFTIGPCALTAIRSAMKTTPLDYIILCPSEAVCARRAAARPEGAMPDYSPYRDLYAEFCDLGEFERHAIRDDDASPEELAATIRTGLAAGTYRVDAVL
ncbi:MAG: AAA family ATPase [Capsulimonadaceae bacterium]